MSQILLVFIRGQLLCIVNHVTSLFQTRDAEDAVHARDGYDYDGYRLRVEFPRGSQSGGGGSHR
jgi:hypothetical protein